MEELIKLLEDLFDESNNHETFDDEADSRYTYFSDTDDVGLQVGNLCCEHLITKDGGCNWTNIGKLEDAGYRVFAGDRDSFGWLTGCIQKEGDKRRPRPTVVYG